MATQEQLAQQLVLQLRVLDPSVSAEIGTPERKILDTFAQALAENQIDINQVSGALDLDSKVGSDLDNFLAIFRFGRQQGSQATGFVTFSRITATNYTVSIPSGTQVMAPNVTVSGVGQSVTYTTMDYAEITPGSLSAIAPVRCTQTGTIGNVGINQITTFAATPIVGITSITNEVPTTGGVAIESDDELKVRFRNTVFRNLAGTQDQFLALAIATQFTTKANVLGPVSRYREYLQIPDVDDSDNDPDSGINGNGIADEWTTALSTVPYSKYIYSQVPYFVTDGKVPNTTFFRRDHDFKLNFSDVRRNRGDTYRADITAFTLTSFPNKPNISFYNVITDPAISAEVQGIRPGDILYFEHSYMSEASRNDIDRQVLNCVDLYVNGLNDRPADAMISRPAMTGSMFTTNSSDAFYFDNYRRLGEPNHRPVVGNLFTPMFWQPVSDLPDKLVTSDATYLRDVHYWTIIDVSDIGRSIRSRNGIEWNPNIPGKDAGDPVEGPYTGPKITATLDTEIKVLKYFYDRNIIDLQTALDGNKQITTDTLAHQATLRYFKIDITIMYSSGSSAENTNAQIGNALSNYFANQFFGSAIQLSDILQVIHNVGGVDNVRWSKELLSGSTDQEGSPRNRVTECDINGNQLTGLIIDRKTPGNGIVHEVHTIYQVGNPNGGLYKLQLGTVATADITWNDNAAADKAAINAALTAASIGAQITAGTGLTTDPWILTFTATGYQTDVLELVDNRFLGGFFAFNSDFFLKDDQLPTIPVRQLSTDSVPGVIIRKRAQSTWNAL